MYQENFYKKFIAESINPFILFNSDAKLIDFNNEAEILFNYVKPATIFELAMSHSPHNFGFECKYINLRYSKMVFYAIVVGYIDDEYIGIKAQTKIDLYPVLKDCMTLEKFSWHREYMRIANKESNN